MNRGFVFFIYFTSRVAAVSRLRTCRGGGGADTERGGAAFTKQRLRFEGRFLCRRSRGGGLSSERASMRTGSLIHITGS